MTGIEELIGINKAIQKPQKIDLSPFFDAATAAQPSTEESE